MKKILKATIIIVFMIFIGLYIYENPETIKNIVNNTKTYAKIITAKEPLYNEEEYINTLNVKSSHYYYSRLTDNQKLIYHAVANGIKNLEREIVLKEYQYIDNDTLLEDIDITINYFYLDHPEVFYVENEYFISEISSFAGKNIILNLEYTVSTLEELNQNIERMIPIIEEYLNKVEGKSKMEAEIILHDELGKNVKYYKHENLEDVPAECHTIEGAFINQTAVCDGISKAMQILLSKVDITNIIVLGKLEEVSHAWNMVELDGNWYHLDITSDKSVKALEEKGAVIHSYFNIMTKDIEKSHFIANDKIIPVAVANEYNYYFYTKKYITLQNEFDDQLKEILQNDTHPYAVEFYTEETKNISEKIYRVVRNLSYYYDYDDVPIHFTYYNVLNSYILIKK